MADRMVTIKFFHENDIEPPIATLTLAESAAKDNRSKVPAKICKILADMMGQDEYVFGRSDNHLDNIHVQAYGKKEQNESKFKFDK
jgi:hypothetical protein